MPSTDVSLLRTRFRSPDLWFAILLGAVCVWVLTLPVFPSQDGPMHRYYVHALAAILQHQPGYDLYQIRHPFPPYATHYFMLLGLSYFVSFDWAEKLFVCITIVLFALGLQLTAKAVGPAGKWAALFVAPLLLSWALMMGFFNYVLGMSLVLLATAFWQRSRNGKPFSLLWYVLVVCVLTFTHPIPLLLLIFVAGMDVLLNWWFRSKEYSSRIWLRDERLRIAALVLTCLAMSFPAQSIDHSRADTDKTIRDTRFKPEFARTAILLTGVSPYNTRTRELLPNAYRLSLYGLLAGALWVGIVSGTRKLKDRQPNLGTTLLIAVPILLIALPILPNEVNGSFYFSTRLFMVLWPAALIAASTANAPTRRQQNYLVVAAGLVTWITLASAQSLFRPISRQLKLVESATLPDHQTGLILLGNKLPDYARYGSQLAFDPFEWGTLLPVTRQNDIVLDAPWMDQKIAPLVPTPGSGLLLPDIAATEASKDDPPAVSGRSLPAFAEAALVRRANFLVFAGTPQEMAQGLKMQMSADEPAGFSCRIILPWYQICTRANISPMGKQ